MYVSVFLLKIEKFFGRVINNIELHSLYKSDKRIQENYPMFLGFQDLVRKEGIVWRS